MPFVPSRDFAQFAPASLSETHREALRRDGVCVVDDCVDVELVRAARAELLGQSFVASRQPKRIRSDTVRWIDEEEGAGGGGGAGVLASVVRVLKGVGSHFECVLGHAVDAPSKCMAAMYSPPEDADEPSGYEPHLDHRPPDDDDDYWCWKASRSQSGRVLTCILYLNDDWSEERDGGHLRLFLNCSNKDDVGTATEVRDVAPIGGRLVVFRARDVPHAVLPVSRARLAMSCWHLMPDSEAA